MPISPDDDNDISSALNIARQPNLVTEDDVAGTWSPRSNPTQGQTLNSYSPSTEVAPKNFMEKLPGVLYNHFVDPMVKAVTAPGRVYRGEVPEDQMIDEAKNMAGQVMLGSFGVGVPSALREGINPNVLRSGFGGAESLSAPTRQLNDIGLYSHAAEQASTLQPRGDATQMISTLKNMQGVKPEELQNAGLIDAQGNVHPEWAGRGKITREDLAGHLQSSMPQVQETVLGQTIKGTPYPEEYTKIEQSIIDKYKPEFQKIDNGNVEGVRSKFEINNDLDSLGKIFNENIKNNRNFDFTEQGKSMIDQLKLLSKERDNYTSMAIKKRNDLQEKMQSEIDSAIPNREQLLEASEDKTIPTKYGDYTLPGSENYREVLLKLPEGYGAPKQALDDLAAARQRFKDLDKRHSDELEAGLTGDMNMSYEDFDKLTRERDIAAARVKNFEKLANQSAFQSGHWQDPNVLAHLRMADRTGPNGEKILHVEEIQSDWGQKGRDEGFQQNMTPEQIQERNDLSAKSRGQGYLSRDELMRLENLDRIATLAETGIPTAPYVTNTGSWTDLALKRALKEAAEGGYDKLVWTPGAEQAGRYSLSNHVDRIAYDPEEKTLSYVPKNNNGRGWTDHPGDVEPKDLAGIIGKDAAERLLAEKPSPLSGIHTLEAPDLSFGGEGMKEYYDKIVPNQLKKISKHYDPNAKVGYTDVMLPPSGKAGTNNPPMAAPGLDITPQMREAIMRGQKAFQRGGRTGYATFGSVPMEDDEIGAALNVARNPDPMGDSIQAKIGGLNQALTGLDLEANTPNFHTGIGGAGMPSRAVPSRPSNTGEDLFDYSRLHEIPNVPQIDLERYVPARGVPVRVQDVMANKDVRNKMLQTIKEGQEKGGANWYNADPLRDKFIENLGADAGDKAFRKYMDMVAATSPRSDVGTNVRNASYYYQRAMAGESMPEVGTPNPQPYGHMAQRLHQMNAQRVAGEGWDALNNPKPASFVENLVGNQAPVTVDTHAFRLPAIHAADPRFLETAFQVNKDAPKQNIQKMVTSGEMPLDEALGRAAYWQAQPKENEYGAMEQYYKSLGQELGLSPAQTQASAWVGGGKLTGLASDESKPFLRFFQDRIYKTANELKMDPNDVMDRFIKGEMTLRASGGRTLGNNAIDNAMRMAIGGDAEIEMPHSLKELQDWKKTHPTPASHPSMDNIFTNRVSGFEGAPPMAMPANLDELLAYLRRHHASGGRAHFEDGGDSGGGDSGGSGGSDSSSSDSSSDSSGNDNVRADSLSQNEQRSADTQAAIDKVISEAKSQEGTDVRTGDTPGGLIGDTGGSSGIVSAAQGKIDAATAAAVDRAQQATELENRGTPDANVGGGSGDYMGNVKYTVADINNIAKQVGGIYGVDPTLIQAMIKNESQYNLNAIGSAGEVGLMQVKPSTYMNPGYGVTPGTDVSNLANPYNNIDFATRYLLARAGGADLSTPEGQAKALAAYNSSSTQDARDAYVKATQNAMGQTVSPEKILGDITINPANSGVYAALAKGVAQADATKTGAAEAGSYGRLAENVTDNSGARITDATASPDAAVTAAKAAAVQPSILDRLNNDQISKLEDANKYVAGDRNTVAENLGVDPNDLKARIVMRDGEQKVEYYTKDLGQAIIGDAFNNIGTGISNILQGKPGNAEPSTTDLSYLPINPSNPGLGNSSSETGGVSNYTGKTSTGVNDLIKNSDTGANAGLAVDKKSTTPDPNALTTAATSTLTPSSASNAPYLSELSKYSLMLPSVTGQTAQQWADDNTGGDLSKVHASIQYVNGAPRLNYYSQNDAGYLKKYGDVITQDYQKLFKRAPDVPGEQYWANRVGTGQVSIDDLLRIMASGAATGSDDAINAAKYLALLQNNSGSSP